MPLTTFSFVNFEKQYPQINISFKICLGFLLLDIFWLNTLAWLGVSFGPIRHTQVLLAFIRGSFFLSWGMIKLIFKNLHPVISFCLIIVPNLLLLGSALYAFYVEPFHITETHIEVQVPGLQQPVRMVQISDIHVERTTLRERRLPGRIAALQPDIIVITGDLINESYAHDPKAVTAVNDLMTRLNAPLGVYAINGNVESPKALKTMLAGSTVRAMDNEIVSIPELGQHTVLIGLNFIDWNRDQIVLQQLVKQLENDQFSILLYHKPDLAYAARDLGIDLYLAGHTHGGQVRLPIYGALITNSRYGKTFEMGLYHLDQMTLFVSRGLGFTGGIAPRVRFLAPPEIVIIDLIPEVKGTNPK